MAMIWDYLEIPVLAVTAGSPINLLQVITDFIKHESAPSDAQLYPTHVHHGDGAQLPVNTASADVVVTDPPYFDAIGYADLSDFFYVWLKRGLGDVFPEAFATPQTPSQRKQLHTSIGIMGTGTKASSTFSASWLRASLRPSACASQKAYLQSCSLTSQRKHGQRSSTLSLKQV